uniref:Uncharacterized protein n=2 Tax=Amphimedon queenslandica TaxID=400682 RepID=A0A1X7TFC1_AMPQE
MPRTRRAARKKKNENASEKASEIAEVTPKNLLNFVIRDLQAQMPRTIDLAIKRYEREALKCVRQLPDKSSFPPEIWNMELSEFLLRGGDMESAMQSLRVDKMKEFSVAQEENEKENHLEIEKEAEPPPSVAMSTRLRSTVPASTTAKRKPKQLEEVKLSMVSKTGSPVDEDKVVEGMLSGAIDEFLKGLMPHLSKKAQSKANQVFEDSVSKFKEQLVRKEGDVTLVTPLVSSTRSRRK